MEPILVDVETERENLEEIQQTVKEMDDTVEDFQFNSEWVTAFFFISRF